MLQAMEVTTVGDILPLHNPLLHLWVHEMVHSVYNTLRTHKEDDLQILIVTERVEVILLTHNPLLRLRHPIVPTLPHQCLPVV